jgi:Skp family chaperone for outer membrane proteins
MTRAIVAAVLTLNVTPAVAQEAMRIGAVSLAYVARSSKAGQAGLAAIETFVKQKEGEAAVKAAELQKQQAELQRASTGLSPRALADLQRTFDRSRVAFERFQQDAQAEIERMQTSFDADFRVKLAPVIDAVSREKGLHFVFGLEQAAIVWWSPAVDISADVVTRLDAATK